MLIAVNAGCAPAPYSSAYWNSLSINYGEYAVQALLKKACSSLVSGSILQRMVRSFFFAVLVGHFPAYAAGPAFVISIDGPIGPAVEEHVARGFEEARLQNAKLIVLRIDTPGGLVSSTRGIIKTILGAKRPVIGFVAPSGARAASAGAYILLASHVAVMAPGTNVGSATPVMMGGMPTVPNDSDQPEAPSGHPSLEDKVINDAKAYMRALAEMRGRPATAAEEFVSQAANLTANEALARGLIDMTAISLPEVLQKIQGRKIKVGEQTITISADALDTVTFELSWRDELLALITNPNIAYILLIAGIYGLVIEGSNPGLIVPGVAGAISLLLGLYALQMLPVNYAGLALMGLGVLLMTTEAFVPSFGALGVGGIISFIIGSIMLIDSDVPELHISPVLIGTVALTTAGLFFFVLAFAVKAWRRPAASGNEALIGSLAHVRKWQGNTGQVMAHGEIWNAISEASFEPTDIVTINGVDGLTLTVGANDNPHKTEN